ncbi:MAG TPA: hypothetical protein QF761_14235 [Pirellulales bacterium]|jgi:DNA segregation ATPase FtsK/SpoIIIE-like protein|nr:hypothetical protein [Pirellulales bacterium]
MSLFDTLFLLAQASAEKPSSGGIFSVPNFFFALIGACILMVIIGAICDHRAARDEDDDEEENDELENAFSGEIEDDEFADEAVVAEAETKEEKKRAKQEAKEQKKQEQAEKKQAKAAAKQAKAAAKQAKKKKGKGA